MASSWPNAFAPHRRTRPATTTTASFTVSATPRLKGPIYNPYDKFTQPEFDSWIDDLTGTLRRALGHVQDENDAPSVDPKGTSETYTDKGDVSEDVDSEVDDTFSEMQMRRTVDKGKARDPREGPGFGALGVGSFEEPIDLASDSEEEEEEVQRLSLLTEDDDDEEEEEDVDQPDAFLSDISEEDEDQVSDTQQDQPGPSHSSPPSYELIDYSDDDAQAQSDEEGTEVEERLPATQRQRYRHDDEEVVEYDDDEVESDGAEDEVVEEVAEVKEHISAPQIHRNDGEEDEEYDEDEDEDGYGDDYGEDEDEEDVYEDDEVYEDRRRAHARNREQYRDANEPETLELSDDESVHEDQHSAHEVDDEEEFSQQDMPSLPLRPQLASHEVYDLGDDEDELESSDDDSVVESSPPQEKIPPPSAFEEPSSSPHVSPSPPPAPTLKPLDQDELELAYPSDSLGEADTDQMEVDSDVEERVANVFTEPAALPVQEPEIIEFDLEDDSELLVEKPNVDEPHTQDNVLPEVADFPSVQMDVTEAQSDSYHQPDVSPVPAGHVEGDFLLQFEVEEPVLSTEYKEDSHPSPTSEPEAVSESLTLELEPALDVHPSTLPPRQESPEIILSFSPEHLPSHLPDDSEERAPETFQFTDEEQPAPTFFSLESQTDESLPKEHLPQLFLEDYSATLEQYMPSVLEAAFGEMQDQSTISFDPPPAQFSATIEDAMQYIEFDVAPVPEVTREQVETHHTDVEISASLEDTLLAQPTEESVGVELDEEPEQLLPREQSPVTDTEADQLSYEVVSGVAISIPVQNPPAFDDSMDASFEEIQEDDMQVDVPPSIVEEPSVDRNLPETHLDDDMTFEGQASEATVDLDGSLTRPDDNFSLDVEPTVSIVEADNATPDITEPEIEPLSIAVPAGIEAEVEEEILSTNVGPATPSPTTASHTLPLDEAIDPTSLDEQQLLVADEQPVTQKPDLENELESSDEQQLIAVEEQPVTKDEQKADMENELERVDVGEPLPLVEEELADTVEQSPMKLDSPQPVVHVELPSEDVPEVSIERRSPTPENALFADEEPPPETAPLIDEEPAAIDIHPDSPQPIVNFESLPVNAPEVSRHSPPIPLNESVVELTAADAVVQQEGAVEEAVQGMPVSAEVVGLEIPDATLVEEQEYAVVELEISVGKDVTQAEDIIQAEADLTTENISVETQPSIEEEIFSTHQDSKDMVQEADVGLMPENDSDATVEHDPHGSHSPVAETQQLPDVTADVDVVEYVHTVEVEMNDASALGHGDATSLPEDSSESVEENYQHLPLQSDVVDEHPPELESNVFDISQEPQVAGDEVLPDLHQPPQQYEDSMVWESQETVMTETVTEIEAEPAQSPVLIDDTVESSSAALVEHDTPDFPPTPTVTEANLENFEARVPSPTPTDPLEDPGTFVEQTAAALPEKSSILLPIEQEPLDAPASLPTPPEEHILSREPSPKPNLEKVEHQEPAVDHTYPDEERLTPVPPSSDEVTGDAQQPSVVVSGDETPKAQDKTPTDDREEVPPPVREEDSRDEVVAPSSPLSTVSQRSKSPLFTPPASPRSRNTEDVQGNVCHRCTFVNELTDVRCRICYTKLRARSTKDDSNGGGAGPSSRKSQSMGSLSKPDSHGSSSTSSSAGPSSLAKTNLPLGRSLTLTIPARRSSQGGLARPSALGQSVITAPGDPSDVFNESPRKPSRTYAHRDHKYRDTEGSASTIGKRKRNEPSSSKASAGSAKEKGKQRATSPAPSDATSISSKGTGKPKRTKSLAKGKLAVRSASIASTATDKSEKTPTASVATPKSTTTQFWPSSLLYGNSQPTRRHQHHLPVAAADGSTDALYSASPVTRSNCKYRRISLPRYEGGPRIEFLVPGCTLGDAELMEEEEIVDCGDVNVEQASRAIQDIGNLDFDAYLMGILRQLVGLDLLREEEVFYLPKIGEDPKEFRRKRKSSVGLTLTSPKSQAPMSSPLTPSIVARRVVDVRESDSEEEEEESSGSEQSPIKPKRAGKKRQIRRLAKDALEYKPTMEESDDDVQAESSTRGRKNGLKRTRTQEDDGEDEGKKAKRRR